MGRGWGRRSNRSIGPGARFGGGRRPGRSYQGTDVCPYCQGLGHRPVIQQRPMRGNRGQGFRGGRGGGGFGRGAGLPCWGAWNGPGRGWQGRNVGPRGRRPMMMQRGAWGGNRSQGPRSGGVGRGFGGRDTQRPSRGEQRGPDRGFQGRGFVPRGQGSGPGPMMQRRPMGNGRGQGFGPGRGFNRGDTPSPEGQGRGINRPDRHDRPLPGPRWGRGRDDRPGAGPDQGAPDRPAGHPEEKDPETKVPAEEHKPKEDPPEGEEV